MSILRRSKTPSANTRLFSQQLWSERKKQYDGEIVKAFVIVKEGKAVTEKELVDYCKKNLPITRCPAG